MSRARLDGFWKVLIVVFILLNIVLAVSSRSSSKPGMIMAGAVGFGLGR